VTTHLFSADVSPPLQTLNGTIDRVDEYDASLFQPAHPELEEYDEEEGGFIYNVTYHYFIYQLVFLPMPMPCCHAPCNRSPGRHGRSE
jgi:hypothetical protein